MTQVRSDAGAWATRTGIERSRRVDERADQVDHRDARCGDAESLAEVLRRAVRLGDQRPRRQYRRQAGSEASGPPRRLGSDSPRFEHHPLRATRSGGTGRGSNPTCLTRFAAGDPASPIGTSVTPQAATRRCCTTPLAETWLGVPAGGVLPRLPPRPPVGSRTLSSRLDVRRAQNQCVAPSALT
jgi:hypothetical protein